MRRGVCRLCGKLADLVESHIWSSFGYRRYVADQSKGGSFLDLAKLDVSNHQYWQYWFCEPCDTERLSSTESYAGRFCSALDRDRTGPRAYDGKLLHFLTGISFRTALFDIERGRVKPGGKLGAALRHWKQFLLGKRTRSQPYSQHLFVVFGQDVDWHKMMGGEVIGDAGLVLSQFGPLLVVGLLDRRSCSLADLRVWDESEVQAEGGVVHPVTGWEVGKTISLPLARVLAAHQKQIFDRALAAGKNL
jgi:hypothetical protein